MTVPSAIKSALAYQLADGTRLVFEDAVLRCFQKHRQLKPKDAEAGGQLFAKISSQEIIVCLATVPRAKDIRSRFGIKLDRPSEQREISENFKNGLHYVGDWHTHPEPKPTPSSVDVKSIVDCFAKSKHELNGFLMVIVGQVPSPEGVWVGVYHGGALSHLF